MLFGSCAFAQKQQTPLPKDLPPYGPEKPLQAPSVKIAKLDNGLTVWLVSKPGFPTLSYSVSVRGGLAADPTDRPGISELLSNTIDQGTKSRNAKKIAEDFQGAGGDLSANAEKDSIEVSTTVLAAKAEPAMAVLADILQNASFPDDEVALAKSNLADSLQQQEADPGFLASRRGQRSLREKSLSRHFSHEGIHRCVHFRRFTQDIRAALSPGPGGLHRRR
jgi:predicted Zn-dependent peptidase